jgi:Disulphide bond corrector protein DsbC
VPTTVSLSAKNKLEKVKVDYPAGEEMKDPTDGKTIRVYEGKTTIKVALTRPKVDGKFAGDPIEVTIKYQVCDDKQCLPPKTVKLTVD